MNTPIKLNTGTVPAGPKVYLKKMYFSDEDDYAVEVTDGGLIVYSECCADTMSRETMIATRDAINAWLADHPE